MLRHIILCALCFIMNLLCQAQIASFPENKTMSDTMRTRILKQEAAQEIDMKLRKKLYRQLEQLALKTGDEALLATCDYEIAYIASQQADYSSSIKHAQRALHYYEAEKNTKGRVNCYRIMANIYSLLSPEQSELYYHKCFEIASPFDSAFVFISKCMMMSLHPSPNDQNIIDDIYRIQIDQSQGISVAAIYLLYAMAERRSGNIDAGLSYALKADTLFSVLPAESFLNGIIKHELASLYFAHGDLYNAKRFLASSEEICQRDGFCMISVSNLQLQSEMLYAEGKEVESLVLYRKCTDIRDSLLGLNQVRSLNELLMRSLLNESVQEYIVNDGRRKWIYMLVFIILITGVILLYYFKNNFSLRKEKYHLLSQLGEQHKQLSSSPELKQHLSVIMFEYKKGLDYYMEQSRKKGNTTEDYQNLHQYINEASAYADRLKKWIDEQPYGEVSNVYFNAHQTIGIVVRMLGIIFASKQMTIQDNVEQEVVVFGNEIYFSTAFEIMLYRLLQDTEDGAFITLSSRNIQDFLVFTLATPKCVITDENRTLLLKMMQKIWQSAGRTISLENSDEICLKCICENGGNIWFESTPDQGTVLNFTVPTKGNKEKSKISDAN